MIEPIRMTLHVNCSVEHAFMVWTSRIGQWWPADHTVSAEEGLSVTLEPRVGGRIYERTSAGAEHDWGEVTAWEPPRRLAYRWHLRRDRRDATDVEIRFTSVGPKSTRLEIEHRGWQRLGADGEASRDRNYGGWSTLLPHYQQAAGK
ncbi:SRPBCC family protein [soil metagenome]